MYQRSASRTRLEERLSVDPNAHFVATVGIRCPRHGGWTDLRPILVLSLDGTACVTIECQCGLDEHPSWWAAVALPGFRTGRDLVDWLVEYGAAQMLDEHRDSNANDAGARERAIASVRGVLDAIAAGSRRMRRHGQDVVWWRPDVDDVLEEASRQGVSEPLSENEVERLIELVSLRDDLLVHPATDTGVLAAQARIHWEVLNGAGDRESHLRLAGDTATDAEILSFLARLRDPGICNAILMNTSASHQAKLLAASCGQDHAGLLW